VRSRFVIVGAGQAASQAAASLRHEGFTGAITLLGEESYAPYQRPPLSKRCLLEEVAVERLLLKPDAFYTSADIEVRLSARVVSIDLCDHEVVLADGARIDYEHLLLATGARPRELAALPAQLQGVHYLRTVADSTALALTLRASRHLSVVGGGYIGLEVAAAARQMGLEVDVIEAAPRLMARTSGAMTSEYFRALHARRGVTVRVGVSVAEVITENRQVRALQLHDGSEIATDAVLIGVGAVPNVELAQQAGLSVDNGVVVDRFTRTSDPQVFAAGDCSNYPDLRGRRWRLESVQNAIEQARVAASNMCGRRQPYCCVPWFWSDQYEIKFQAAGCIDGHDEVIRSDVPGGFALTYLAHGKVIAVEAANAPAAFMSVRRQLEALLEQHTLEEIS